jgi:propane monooxygenase coupling protein
LSNVPKSKGSDFTFSHEQSNRCGVTLSIGVEGNVIADIMSKKPGVKVTRYPAMIRIDGERKLEFDLQEIADALGVEEYTPADFELSTSTHYGRMVRLEDKVLVFANPEDAAEYISFEAKEA